MRYYAVVPCLLLALTGCGDRLATVSGSVTLDGKPLGGGKDVRAMIQFLPVQSGAPATGTLNEAGRFELTSGSKEGLPPGNYFVTVSASKLVPAATPGDPASGRALTPRRYANAKQSGLSAEVKPGDNTFEFALVSGGP